jgi:hypothetical protein
MEKYTGDLSSLDLGKLDFPRARKEWKKLWEERANL